MPDKKAFGFNAASTSPTSPGTYLVYDTGDPYSYYELADYNPGSVSPDVSPDLSDWSTTKECIPYSKDELKTLFWFRLPGDSVEPDVEEIPAPEVEGREPYFERHYLCPNCTKELGVTAHTHYIYYHSTVLQDNRFPNFCPHCGCRLNWETAELPESFLDIGGFACEE